MVCSPPPSSFFLFLPQKQYYYHYEICNSASRQGEGKDIKRYVRGFYDNYPWYSSDW